MYLHCFCLFVCFISFCKRQNDFIDVINVKKNTFQLNLERKITKQNFKRYSRLREISRTTFMRKDIKIGVIRLANCGAGIYQSAEEMTIVEFV